MMRILYCEWKKFSSVRILWILLSVLLLINGYAQITGTKEREYAPEDYRNLHAILSEMEPSEADQYLEQQMEASAAGDAVEYIWELYAETRQEVQRILNYPEYLANICLQSNSMAAVSIWGGTDTFSYRNIQKTPAAYEKMAGTVLVPDPSLGIEDALQNSVTDFIGIFLVFLIVSAVMLKDREQKIQPLLYSMPYGREGLFCHKLLLIVILTAGVVVLFVGENLVIGGMMYGIGDLSRPAQSIGILYQCNLPISLGSYLILYFLMKTAAFLVFAVIFMLICSCSDNNLMVYSLSGAACGISLLLYRMVQSLSTFGILHYLNPVQLVHVNEVLGNYCNINLLGYPFSLKWAAMMMIAALLTGCTVISAFRFANARNAQYRNISIRLQKHRPHRVHGQFYYVCYRSMVQQKGIFVTLAVLFAAFVFSSGFHRFYTSNDIYYETFTTQLEGVITQDTLDFLNEKESFYADIYRQISELEAEGMNMTEISELCKKLYSESAFLKLQTRVQAIQNSPADGELFYDTGYERLFGIDGNQEDLIIILFEMLFLAMLLSPYAAQDRKTDMTKVLYATYAGKAGYWKHLILYSMLCGILVSLLFNVPYVFHILQDYGSQGIGAPIQSITAFARRNAHTTVGEEILILLLFRMFSAAVTAALMDFVSSVMRSPVTAYIANISLFVLPVVLIFWGMDALGEIGLVPILSYSRLIL